MVEDEVRWLGSMAAQLLSEYEQNQPQERSALTFMQIEEIWASEILPLLLTFQSMQYQDRTPPATDSRWRFNYAIPESPIG